MTTYVVTSRATGAEVLRYNADSQQDWQGFPAADFDQAALAEPEPVVPAPSSVFGGRRRLTKLEFVSLLGEDEFKAVLTAAEASVDVAAWVKLIELLTPNPDGTSVDLDDARVLAGLGAMEIAGVLPAGTAQRVIHG